MELVERVALLEERFEELNQLVLQWAMIALLAPHALIFYLHMLTP